MSPNQDLHRFWRSREGQVAFERTLDEAFQRRFGREPDARFAVAFGEIRAYREFPEPMLVTYISYGLSHFILSNSLEKLSGARVECSWTVAGTVEAESAKRVLKEFSDQVLGAGVVPEVDAISTACSGLMAECGFSTRALLPLTGLWFDPQDCKVDGFYPLYFLELAALTPAEALRAEADRDGFDAWAEATGFDPADPFRKSVACGSGPASTGTRKDEG